jgi:hypothetical protein
MCTCSKKNTWKVNDLKKRKHRFLMKRVRIVYFGSCVLLLFLLAGVRSGPVYGKLNFLLLDSKPWWPEWRPMVTEVIASGRQPVLTDPTTSAVFGGVFAQDTVFQRRLNHQPFLYVENLEFLNRSTVSMVPFGALLLLQEDTYQANRAMRQTLIDLVTDNSRTDAGILPGTVDKEYPFRCVINVHGFTPSWVAGETTHWEPSLAETVWFYRYDGSRGSQLISRLRKDPPQNCTVFF